MLRPIARSTRTPRMAWRHGHLRRAALLSVALMLLAASSAAGTMWRPVVSLTHDGYSGMYTTHTVAASGATVHVIYHAADGKVSYRRSRDAGATWEPEQTIEAVVAAEDPKQALAAAADGDRVLLVYRAESTDHSRHHLYVRRSGDGGTTWQPRTELVTWDDPSRMTDADVAISGMVAIVSWTDGLTGRIMVRRSTDGGVSWRSATSIGTTRLTDRGGGHDGHVAIALAGARAYVSWMTGVPYGAPGFSGLAVRRSSDGGASFSPQQSIARIGLYNPPSLAAAGATMLLIYSLDDGTVKLARSTDGGATIRQVTLDRATAHRDADDVVISGSQARVTSHIGGRISMRKSTNGGRTWTASEVVSSGASAFHANVVLAPGVTVVAWQGARTGSLFYVLARRSS